MIWTVWPNLRILSVSVLAKESEHLLDRFWLEKKTSSRKLEDIERSSFRVFITFFVSLECTTGLNKWVLWEFIECIIMSWYNKYLSYWYLSKIRIKEISSWYLHDVCIILTLFWCLKFEKLRSKRHWIDGYKISIWKIILSGHVSKKIYIVRSCPITTWYD
jgi:hypothetical protein